GGGKQILPDAIETGGGLESSELNLSAVLRRGLPWRGVADSPVRRDRDGLRARRDRDLRFERLAVEGYYIAFPIEVEGAGARVGELAVGPAHLEETVPLDRQIERVRSIGQAPLRHHDLVGGGTCTQSDLQAGGNHGLRTGGGAGLDYGLVKKVLKLNLAGLEADRAGVGEIVRDVVDAHFLGAHPARRAIQCSNHSFVSP